MLKDKIAFITGASAGIGAAVARALSAEGVKLGLASRRGSNLGLDEAVGVTRPRGMRILESAFRPMKEASWG